MIQQSVLDEYRPYYDNEVPEAVARIASDSLFEPIVRFVFPEEDYAAFVENFRRLGSVYDFQTKIMVLVVEDGSTLTHGEMKIGAGTVAAMKHGAAELIDPRPYTVGKLKDTFKNYPEIGVLLPTMDYGNQQIKDLKKTIANTPCNAVVIGTPIGSMSSASCPTGPGCPTPAALASRVFFAQDS